MLAQTQPVASGSNILVVGGNGYVGSVLVESLLKAGHAVTVADRHPCSQGIESRVTFVQVSWDDLLQLIDIKSFRTIIILAGITSPNGLQPTLSSIAADCLANFAALLDNVSVDQQVIYASSAAIYTNTNGRAATEEDVPLYSHDRYAFVKRCMENMAAVSGKQTFGLRMGTVCGVSPRPRPMIVNAMVADALSKGAVTVTVTTTTTTTATAAAGGGGGGAADTTRAAPSMHDDTTSHAVSRTILGFNDLCTAIISIIRRGDMSNSGVYNIGSFSNTITALGSAISTLLNCKLHIETRQPPTDRGTRKLEVLDFALSSVKFERTFGIKFSDTLETIVGSLVTHHTERTRSASNSKGGVGAVGGDDRSTSDHAR